MDTFIVLALMLTVLTVPRLIARHIRNKRKFSVKDWNQTILTPKQEEFKSTSLEFLQRVVNQRKAALARLHESGFVNWEEYTTLYNALIQWRDDALKEIEHDTPLYM